jgi:DNA adenine methylase
MLEEKLKAPFPWFGGKSRVADLVWQRLGADVCNYVEPFFGSGAVLLGRPGFDAEKMTETINDKDGFVANFWRAISKDPEAVADSSDWPQNENDLHARHAWLIGQREVLVARLEGDPEFFDAKIAGWWIWGLCLWIGSGWCSGSGPWAVEDGKLLHLGDRGMGINRKLLHLGNRGMGINRKRLHLGNRGRELSEIFEKLSARLRNVRVASGEALPVDPHPAIPQVEELPVDPHPAIPQVEELPIFNSPRTASRAPS